MLGLEDVEDLHAVDVMRAQRWKNVEPLVKSYFGNTIHLLGATAWLCFVMPPCASQIWRLVTPHY